MQTPPLILQNFLVLFFHTGRHLNRSLLPPIPIHRSHCRPPPSHPFPKNLSPQSVSRYHPHPRHHHPPFHILSPSIRPNRSANSATVGSGSAKSILSSNAFPTASSRRKVRSIRSILSAPKSAPSLCPSNTGTFFRNVSTTACLTKSRSSSLFLIFLSPNPKLLPPLRSP